MIQEIINDQMFRSLIFLIFPANLLYNIYIFSNTMRLKSLLKGLLILLILLSSTLYILFAPSHASSLIYQGQQINITRDGNSIPTIRAPSRVGYFYGLGRVHAEDRLFQMSFKLLVIQGRLAEHLGEKPLSMDKFMREVGIYRWGKKIAERMKTENQTEFQAFQGYVDGINDFMSQLFVLPIDFVLIGYKRQNWTVGDVMGLFKLLQWSQSVSLYDEYTRSMLLGQGKTKQEVEKLLPIKKKDWAFDSTIAIDDSLIPEELTTQFLKNNPTPPAFHPQILKKYQQLGLFDLYTTAQGSNEWAISGKHTASGHPILAHDPHLENVMPSQWYLAQAVYDHNGTTHTISGISCSGVPFIVGKAQYLAMGITTIYMDNQDLYKETIKDGKYLVNGKWVDLKIREEKIKVKTNNGTVEETYVIRETHRGPLIHYVLCSFGSYSISEDLSLAWTGFNDEYAPIAVSSHLPQVNNLQQLKGYLLHETEYLFNVNVMFITRDDHIGYQQLGRYPVRANSQSGLYVKDGTTTDHDWLGFVPPTHRLQIIDPPSGYLVSANNRIASQKYYNGIHELTIFTARSDRIHQIIKEGIANGHKYTVGDMKKILADTVDAYCVQILPYIRGLISDADTILADFDCNFVSTSSQAAIYEVFIYQLHHQVKPHKTEKMSVLSMHPNAQYLYNYIKNANVDEKKMQHLRIAWKKMKQNLSGFFKTNQTNEWAWGKYHKDVMHHLPFSNSSLKFLYDRSFDGYGNLHTVNVGKMNKVEFADFETSHRANYRGIYSFAEENFWIIDSGNSQKFFSKYYDDQWQLFRRNEFLTLHDPQYQKPVPSSSRQL